jgi:hypothetical protein
MKSSVDYPRRLKILTDARLCNFRIDPEELPMIIDSVNSAQLEYGYVVNTSVIDTPSNTAIAMLYQQLILTDNYYFKMFSSYEIALEWLKSVTIPK